jgi:phosphatidylserine/phosphatidylglycerophosphate/cardiolipin synthase-like enzyme
LDLVGDSFVTVGARSTWAAVATLPEEVHSVLRPPPLRQAAGVLLGLIDRATKVVRLAAPYVDAQAVAFLSDSLATARRRGADITVVTSDGRGMEFSALDRCALPAGSGGLDVTEVRTELSSLGSHAKVLLVDDAHAYVGSANVTAAGFGRHVEIGVEVSGPQAEDLARLLVAVERLGVRVINAPRT